MGSSALVMLAAPLGERSFRSTRLCERQNRGDTGASSAKYQWVVIGSIGMPRRMHHRVSVATMKNATFSNSFVAGTRRLKSLSMPRQRPPSSAMTYMTGLYLGHGARAE